MIEIPTEIYIGKVSHKQNGLPIDEYGWVNLTLREYKLLEKSGSWSKAKIIFEDSRLQKCEICENLFEEKDMKKVRKPKQDYFLCKRCNNDEM